MLTRARCALAQSPEAPGSGGRPLAGSSVTSVTRAANRRFTSSVSRATATKVPLDCSEAITAAVCCRSSAVSIS